MGSGWTVTGSLIGFFAVPVVVSYVVEAMRSAPATPNRLDWAPEVPIKYIKVNDINLRYVEVGHGPALVLLHTLRTQLDMFQKIIPELSKHFRLWRFLIFGRSRSRFVSNR